jgi:hypothetical protein
MPVPEKPVENRSPDGAENLRNGHDEWTNKRDE